MYIHKYELNLTVLPTTSMPDKHVRLQIRNYKQLNAYEANMKGKLKIPDMHVTTFGLQRMK